MKRNMRGMVAVFVCIMLIFSISVPTYASNSKSNSNSKGFKDVQKGHWSYDAVMWMLERSIIDGIGGEKFGPNDTVSRAQFAKMMVNTLDLKKYSPDTPSFVDVKKKAWEYTYVEAAKIYLTGFRTTNGDYFKPSQQAVREDMAVALVKALGYQNEIADESLLNKFADVGQISPNLRKYVALSVKYGLIEGYTKNGQSYFDPQGSLTRAQAAALLYRAYKSNEEKVTYDEDKVTYENDTYIKPVVSLTTENNKLVVKWDEIESSKLVAYAVVISANDSTPTYQENGCLYYITDENQTSAVIDNSVQYNGSNDFGGYLTKGEKYYFSVTAIYEDRLLNGNTIRAQYNGTENPQLYIMPVISAAEENGKLILRWNKIDSDNFVGYRVVASKNDSLINYPENGYLLSITDSNRNYAVIDNTVAYTGGDFGGYFIKGEDYYFNVTAVYDDRTVPGNTIRFRYNGDDSAALFPVPVVSTAYEEGKLVVKWDKINSSQLIEYRLVISQNNDKPAYTGDGYYNTAYDVNTTSVVIDATKPYTSGDFTTLTYGTEYYFSVTAVYNNNKYVAGNATKVLYLVAANQ